MLGTVVAERYRIQSLLGEGLVGRVYLAIEPGGGEVVVKVLYGEYAAMPSLRLRFLREAEIASRVVHPGVIPVIDIGETSSGMPFLVTPRVEGQLLTQLIRHEAPLPVGRAAGILRDICRGVAEIHRCGVVHQDLSASNIVLAHSLSADLPQIRNLGIALVRNAVGTNAFGRVDEIVGTTAYMAPECFMSQSADRRADFFSLGVLFYELLSGVRPYEGSPLERTITLSAPPSIQTRVPGLSVHPDVEAVASRLMQPAPADRYDDAFEIIAALDGLG